MQLAKNIYKNEERSIHLDEKRKEDPLCVGEKKRTFLCGRSSSSSPADDDDSSACWFSDISGDPELTTIISNVYSRIFILVGQTPAGWEIKKKEKQPTP